MGPLPCWRTLNYLVRLGWSYGDQEIFSREELIDKFTLENVGKSAGIFDIEKLNWLNATPLIQQKGLQCQDKDYLKQAVITLQPRAKTLVEMADAAEFYLIGDEKLEYEPKAAKKFLKQNVKQVMSDLIARLEDMDIFSEEGLEDLFKDLIEAHDIKLAKIAQPVRVALTGRTASPGLFEIMNILGKEHVLARLRKAQKYIVDRYAV